MPPVRSLLPLLAVAAVAGSPSYARVPAGPGDAGPQEAQELVATALDRLGGPDLVERTGGVGFHASGWMDKSAERQGWSMARESRGPFVERLAVAAEPRAVGYDYREDRYDGTWEELREIYEGADRRLIVVPTIGAAIDLRSARHAAAAGKLRRRIPALLLAEVLERPDSLRRLEDRADTLRVSGVLSDGTRLRLHFRRADTLLARASYTMDYLSFGDTEVSWRYDDHRPVEGLGTVPHGYGVSIGGRAFTDMTALRWFTGADRAASLVRVPDGIPVRPPVELGDAADAAGSARVDTLATGVYRVRSLRSGFHPLFVRVGDGLVAFDAPAGYPMPNQLPAGEIAPGPTGDWLSRRYLDLMAEAVPGVPVTHVVITHFHNDHGGGVRAFVAEGATVVASAADTAEIRAFVGAPHRLGPDALERRLRPLRMEAVDGRWTLAGGGRRVEVVEVGPNPHTEGMLVVRLPDDDLVFVSDLLDPTRDPERFPQPSHAALDRWFGRWLDSVGWSPRAIRTMHGSGLVTPAHLDRLDDAEPAPGIEWVVWDRAVEAPGPDAALVEPRLAVHPSDPEHLLVGTIVVDDERRTWHCAALASLDGGTTWARTDFEDMDRCIDPWALLGPGPAALVTGIEVLRDAGFVERFRMLAHRSDDGGATWSAAPDTLGTGFDHPVIVPGASPGDAPLWASRRNALAEDGRPRHEVAVGVLDGPARAWRETGSFTPAVVGLTVTGVAPLSDGTVVVGWWDVQREVDGFEGEGMLERGRAWVARSRDGGRTFGPPFLVGDHCASGGPEAAFPGYPTLEVDRSSASFRDRLYVACVRAGLDGVAVSRSEDGGRRWSDPVRVDGGSPHARTPMLAVNGHGVVAVAWYDRRADPRERCQDVYVNVSRDGGRTFGRAERVNEVTSCPEVPGNEGVARSWPMGGDYGGLAAGPDGDFHLVWADARGGRFDLRTARFRAVARPVG